MSRASFLGNDRALITCMVQAFTPERIKELVSRGLEGGAEAFGMQLCKLNDGDRDEKGIKEIFSITNGRPIYITNYRERKNTGKADEEIARELLNYAEWGATLCDVMGDYFDKNDEQFAMNECAIEKQIRLIDELHSRGAEVLMSSHVFKFTPAERVLEIALGHQARGADISKIVVGAGNMAEQIENLRIINLLKENLKIPFLFLSGGESYISRRIGGALGNCMTLCVVEHDELSTKEQPLLSDALLLRDRFGL